MTRIARHYYARRAVLSPAEKVVADRERAARNALQRAKNTAARKAHMLARAVASNPRACRICGTPISDPRSIERGIGPECWAAQAHKDAVVETAERKKATDEH